MVADTSAKIATRLYLRGRAYRLRDKLRFLTQIIIYVNQNDFNFKEYLI